MNKKDIMQKYYSTDINEYKNNLFVFVREMPYEINGARTPEALLENGKGYCVSKHRLLQNLFGEIGLESDLCFVPFKFSQIYLPESLRGRGYAEKLGYHVFLKVYINGETINVDASFPNSLNQYYKVNTNWDGKKSQEITIGSCKEEFIVKSDEEEQVVKKKLSDPARFDTEDEKWIGEYNLRLLENQ